MARTVATTVTTTAISKGSQPKMPFKPALIRITSTTLNSTKVTNDPNSATTTPR